MEKKLAAAERFVVPRTAGKVLSDVRIDEKRAAGLEIDEGVADICFALAEGFHFRAMQHYAGFQLLKNMIVVRSGAILRDDLLAGLFGVFALPGFTVWLDHNLSFYLKARLIERQRRDLDGNPQKPASVARNQGEKRDWELVWAGCDWEEERRKAETLGARRAWNNPRPTRRDDVWGTRESRKSGRGGLLVADGLGGDRSIPQVEACATGRRLVWVVVL